ncbi:hypothetical protein H5410_004949, partial [Solanum commersonii]
VHSAQLVRIADALGDPPFAMLHHLSALAFSIFAAQHIGTLDVQVIRCLAECIRQSSGLLFFILSVVLFLLPSSVHALPQTPNT